MTNLLGKQTLWSWALLVLWKDTQPHWVLCFLSPPQEPPRFHLALLYLLRGLKACLPLEAGECTGKLGRGEAGGVAGPKAEVTKSWPSLPQGLSGNLHGANEASLGLPPPFPPGRVILDLRSDSRWRKQPRVCGAVALFPEVMPVPFWSGVGVHSRPTGPPADQLRGDAYVPGGPL